MSITTIPNKPLLNYRQQGEGEHILLIHGLFGSLDNLNMVAKVLAESYCVTSIDVANHGNSFHRTDMQYSTLALDVITLLDHLAINNTAILGHSMGGKIAMQIALEYPSRVNKLIIADISPVKYPAHHTEIIQGLKSIDFSKVNKRQDADSQLALYVDDQGIRQFLLRNITLNDNKQWQFKCSINDIAQCYPQIMQENQLINGQQAFNGDTLFIKGGTSNYILPEHKTAIAALFPNAKAKIIQGAGHWLHAEKTIAFNKIVLEFIKN
jgi:esterase